VTIFPEIVEGYASATMLSRAAQRGVWELRTFDPRSHTNDVHRSVDDTPFGGGAGMVMTPEPVVSTVRAIEGVTGPVIALLPSGRRLTHAVARELASLSHITLLCGRYEGVDQRAVDLVATDAISIGDVVLAGGELAALCVIEAVVRLLPGALGNDESALEESFSDGLLEYPQFTKPALFEGREVPAVLRSGDHGRIERWRRAQSLHRTVALRPDLIEQRGGLSDEDRRLMAEFVEYE
jgi:tRNA (guanine37-N1)-methyltransferase